VFHPLIVKTGERFSSLRTQNTLIDVFFDRRESDPAGGEDGKRISQVRTRPVYGLTFGRMRGATWFETGRPPQAIVWLLDAQIHDERHKGSADAYDIFGQLEESGQLFPLEVDYKWLELDRRLLDTESFAEDVRTDARTLVDAARQQGRATGTIAHVPARLAWEQRPGDIASLYVAVSTRPVTGPRSGRLFPLNRQRFLLLAEAVRQAGEDIYGPEVLVDDQPAPSALLGHRHDERTFLVLFEHAPPVAGA
jgi:hypothetical protein